VKRIFASVIVGMMMAGGAAADDENRIGLTGEARAAFIRSTVDACNGKTPGVVVPLLNTPDYCSCYANALADSVSIKELKEPAPENREAAISALRPKIEAAAKRCAGG
jgi:hypothetical protein